QLDMQERFTEESMGLQRQQMTLQRGWTRQDWGYQDQTRGMQWGWKQEDFAEGARFMTGRDRRLAERQMERDTIMYGLEGEQIERQRDRQEILWGLEDERFDLQKRQNQESLDMQRERLEKMREFFEQRKDLEQQSVELNREYWERNIALQEESIGIQAGYAKAQLEINTTMAEFSDEATTARDSINLLNEESFATLHEHLAAIDPLFSNFVTEMGNVKGILTGEGEDEGLISPVPDAPGSEQPESPFESPVPPAGGSANVWYCRNGHKNVGTKVCWCGESPDVATTSSFNNLSSVSGEFISAASAAGGGGVTIPIYIGDEKIAEYIVSVVGDVVEM
ncbi:MAG: hypothetical protein RTU30_05280, partial [Candidatus Thorarchaeota archaeon]